MIDEDVKQQGFGRPYENMGGGPLDWFECSGMPLSELTKECHYYPTGFYYSGAKYLGDYKRIWPDKRRYNEYAF